MISANIKEWLEPDCLLLLESWARDGMTVEQISAKIGIHKATLCAWMAKHEEIKNALRNGRELIDYKVESALLKSALGYKTRELKVVTTMKNGKVVEIKEEKTDKEFPPNVGAIQMWLANRRSDKWKRSYSNRSVLEEIGEDSNITIKIERADGSESELDASSCVYDSQDETDTDWQNDVNRQVTLSSGKRKKNQAIRKDKQVSCNDGSILADSSNSESVNENDQEWGNCIYEG